MSESMNPTENSLPEPKINNAYVTFRNQSISFVMSQGY